MTNLNEVLVYNQQWVGDPCFAPSERSLSGSSCLATHWHLRNQARFRTDWMTSGSVSRGGSIQDLEQMTILHLALRAMFYNLVQLLYQLVDSQEGRNVPEDGPMFRQQLNDCYGEV